MCLDWSMDDHNKGLIPNIKSLIHVRVLNTHDWNLLFCNGTHKTETATAHTYVRGLPIANHLDQSSWYIRPSETLSIDVPSYLVHSFLHAQVLLLRHSPATAKWAIILSQNHFGSHYNTPCLFCFASFFSKFMSNCILHIVLGVCAKQCAKCNCTRFT